jgi:hypothetical protein
LCRRRPRFCDAAPVAGENGLGDRAVGDAHTRRKARTGDEANEIERVGHACGLVEVVDAPDKAAFDVAPGAVVLDVHVADGEHRRRVLQVLAHLLDGCGPAEIGAAQEDERVFTHPLMLGREVVPHDIALFREPGFVGLVVVDE